jgi:hypothetical protein
VLTAQQRPATGRFHALARPTRVVSDRAVGAHARKTFHLGGHHGLPGSGLRALAVTLEVDGPKGGTEVYAGPGTHRPAAPSVVTNGKAASSLAIVPVTSTGALSVWAGRRGAAVTLTVTGWFSSRAESGSAGLFNRLANREVSSLHLGGAKHAAVEVAGHEDVPATGAAALLVRVTVRDAVRGGLLGLGPTAKGAGAARSLQYAPGTTSDLAVVRLEAGRLALDNGGPKGVSVSLTAVGWFTSGHDAAQFGDGLQVARPQRVAKARHVGTGGLALTTAGIGSIPGATSPRPTSLVLWRSSLLAPSRNATVSVDPASASRSHIPARTVQRGRGSAGLVLTAADATNRSVVYSSAGSVTLTAEAYAWFAGSVVIADGTRVLAGTTLSAVSSVDPDQVTFTGHPAALADLAPGNVLVAGVSGATPVGLLRSVDSVDASGTDTVVATSAASLTDVVLQGSLSAGTASGPPTLTKPTPRLDRRSATGSCDAGGSLLFGGLHLGCSGSFGDGVWTVGVDAQASASLGLDVSIGFALPPSIDVTTTMDVSASASATFTATAAADLDESYPLGERTLEPIEFPIGPVPIVIVPKVDAQLHVTGHLEATLAARAEYSAGLTAECSTDGGCSVSDHNGGSGSGSYQADLEANAKAAFEPKVEALLYDVAGVTATMSPYVGADADSCVLTLKSGVDLDLGVELTVLDETVASASVSIPLVESTLARVVLRNCAVWSGDLSFRAHYNVAGSSGPDYSYTHDGNGSSSMHINDVGGDPPQYGYYSLSGSGSGVDKFTETDHICTADGYQTNKDTYNWSGSVTDPVNGTPISIQIQHGSGETWFLDQLSANGGAAAPADETSEAWSAPPPDGTCKLTVTHTSDITWTQDVFQVFSEGETSAGSHRLTFTVPAGSNTSSGTASFPQDGAMAAYTLTWNLTKTCLMGGTTCGE